MISDSANYAPALRNFTSTYRYGHNAFLVTIGLKTYTPLGKNALKVKHKADTLRTHGPHQSRRRRDSPSHTRATVTFTPTKTQLVAYYFIGQLKSVTRTKLVKLIYLADYFNYSAYGHQLTDADYRRQQRGPLPVKFDERINEMRGHEVELSEKPMFDGKMIVHTPGTKPRFAPNFTEIEKRVLDNILAWYGHLPGKTVTEIAYQTKPMIQIIRRENETGHSCVRESIDFEKYLPEFRMQHLKERYEKIRAAREELSPVDKKALEERDLSAYDFSEGFRRLSLTQLLAHPVA